jgi:transcriptional regulator with XRE-family HTH domain
MDMIGRIRRLHSRKKKSEREISRITGLSRNTVAKWLHGEVDGPPKYRRGEQPNKLTVFHEALKLSLKADARRPKHERRTAKALYAEIKLAGYDGGYTRVTDFIRAWRQGEGQGAAVNAFIPLAFELGDAYQFDWSEEGLVVGGSRILKEQLTDPAYFAQMSALLDEIIRLRRERAIEYEAYLARMAQLAQQVVAGKAADTPAQLRTAGQLALYNNLRARLRAAEPAASYGPNGPAADTAELALRLDAAIKQQRPDGWRGVVARELMVKNAMFGVLGDVDAVNALFPVVFAQAEY